MWERDKPFELFNTLRQRQNGRHFADDVFKRIFLIETVWISLKISLKFVPKGPVNNIPALVQIMAWRRPGDKPLSEPMMTRLPTHVCALGLNELIHRGVNNIILQTPFIVKEWPVKSRAQLYPLTFESYHIEAEIKWPSFADDIFKCFFFNENV